MTASHMTSGLMSSDADGWTTPPELFLALDWEFGFTLDVAAGPENAKCNRYFTVAEDGLSQPWAPETCWMNPPYGKTIGSWVEKAWHESTLGATVVGLLPSRTDTAWWHDYVSKATDVRFLRGRVRFGGIDPKRLKPSWGGRAAAPFPSAVVVWRP